MNQSQLSDTPIDCYIPDGDPGIRYAIVNGFPGYAVGTDGSVWSRRYSHPHFREDGSPTLYGQWRRMKPSFWGKYLVVHLRNDKERPIFKVHNLVLETFVGPRPPGMEACHYPDPNHANCWLENLRWDTRQANILDSIKQGLLPKGEKHHKATLTNDLVYEFRQRYAQGGVLITELAADYGIPVATMGKVIRRETWRHLPDKQMTVETPI